MEVDEHDDLRLTDVSWNELRFGILPEPSGVDVLGVRQPPAPRKSDADVHPTQAGGTQGKAYAAGKWKSDEEADD